MSPCTTLNGSCKLQVMITNTKTERFAKIEYSSSDDLYNLFIWKKPEDDRFGKSYLNKDGVWSFAYGHGYGMQPCLQIPATVLNQVPELGEIVELFANPDNGLEMANDVFKELWYGVPKPASRFKRALIRLHLVKA
jgi:hypothetical protein